jgi:hypothetical protein
MSATNDPPSHWRAYEAASRLAEVTAGNSHDTRTVTSGWVLAGFAGLGYLASADHVAIASAIPADVARPLAMTAVSYFAGVGVSVNGLIDAQVFRRAWRGAIAELVRLELRHHDLPALYSGLRLSGPDRFRRITAWFALAPALMFFAIGGLTSVFALREAGFSTLWQLAAACFAVAWSVGDMLLFQTLERSLPLGPTRGEVQAIRPDA